MHPSHEFDGRVAPEPAERRGARLELAESSRLRLPVALPARGRHQPPDFSARPGGRCPPGAHHSHPHWQVQAHRRSFSRAHAGAGAQVPTAVRHGRTEGCKARYQVHVPQLGGKSRRSLL
jgi:hypothetical protein